jgi:hypothetical protein
MILIGTKEFSRSIHLGRVETNNGIKDEINLQDRNLDTKGIATREETH